MTRTFSKSKLLTLRQCTKRLWLELYRPELRVDSASSQRVFKTGHEVGEIARDLYDPDHRGHTIDLVRVGYHRALQQTLDLLAERLPIFEAGFAADGVMSFADALLPINSSAGDAWRMVEVKSSTGLKDYYYDDVSVQAFAARRSGLNLVSVSIAHVDRNWTYPGNGNYSGLLREEDLTEHAFNRDHEVAGWVKEATEIASLPTEPEIRVGPQCSQPFECGFYTYCMRKEERIQHPISWLPQIRSKKLTDFIRENNAQSMSCIPDSLLNERQRRVKAHTLNESVYFDREAARDALQALDMPLYFLDFETIAHAVPRWKGRRPYEQIPFQFSVHSIDVTWSVTHKSFIDISGDDPTRALMPALIEACGSSGSILVYHAAFEKSRIKELIKSYPKVASELSSIVDRIFDLLPIAERFYYHPMQEGSWSIKKLLPAIAPDLNYNDLTGVKDGFAAIDAYLDATDGHASDAERQVLKHQLEEYCKLDTEAMIYIWSLFAGIDPANLKNLQSHRH